MRLLRFYLVLLLTLSLSSCGIFGKKSKITDSAKSKAEKASKKAILNKYSEKLGARVTNGELYMVIDGWMGVPYKYGGKDKGGIDCSHFICEILRSAFYFPSEYYFPSSRLAEQGIKIEAKEAKEGDLIFFAINQKSKISHVGIYLANNKFVHASTSNGVMISSLDENYYKNRLAYMRRLK